MKEKHIKQDAAGKMPVCPNCGGREVNTSLVSRKFNYGVDKKLIAITATVPLRNCVKCGFEYFDNTAEQIEHEAICKHLKLLTPEDIINIRNIYGYSRAEFADITKLGEATLGRWERGALIQNDAYDQFLYLLKYCDNIQRLRARNSGDICCGSLTKDTPYFRQLTVTSALRTRRDSFRLSAEV